MIMHTEFESSMFMLQLCLDNQVIVREKSGLNLLAKRPYLYSSFFYKHNCLLAVINIICSRLSPKISLIVLAYRKKSVKGF